MNNTIIFGDSYSTFKGYVPEGYAVYYSESGRPETDVTDVSQTWWYQVCEKAGLNLIHNNSWSGSTIGYTGYGNSDCSHSSSFIYRLKQLADSGFFTNEHIDTVFVFGGTNDSWSNAPLGGDESDCDLYHVLPAIRCFLAELIRLLPNASIYCLINTEIKHEIADCLADTCKKHNITPVTFDKIDKRCGHPTIRGMIDISDAVLRVLNNE